MVAIDPDASPDKFLTLVDPARIGSFRGLLSMPFQQEVRPSLTQKSGSDRAYVDNMPT